MTEKELSFVLSQIADKLSSVSEGIEIQLPAECFVEKQRSEMALLLMRISSSGISDTYLVAPILDEMKDYIRYLDEWSEELKTGQGIKENNLDRLKKVM